MKFIDVTVTQADIDQSKGYPDHDECLMATMLKREGFTGVHAYGDYAITNQGRVRFDGLAVTDCYYPDRLGSFIDQPLPKALGKTIAIFI